MNIKSAFYFEKRYFKVMKGIEEGSNHQSKGQCSSALQE